jgi:arabinofuranosyltransferase
MTQAPPPPRQPLPLDSTPLVQRALSVAIALFVPLTLLAFSRIEIVDDAFITYRYAQNLARGSGLVFNRGEYVEGITNLLWTLLMAVPQALGLPVYLVAAALGLGFAMLAMFDVWRICRLFGVAPSMARAATVVLGLYPGYWLTAMNGLEGGLFSFLLMRTLYAVLSETRSWIVGIWGGLLFMTRPESVLIMVPITVYALLDAGRRLDDDRARRIRHTMTRIAYWLACVGAVTLWRRWYFGGWIPNTIAAKSMPRIDLGALMGNVRLGVLYYRDFMASTVMITLGAVLAPLLAPRIHGVWLLVGVLALQIPIVLANGGDWMPQSRLLAVYAPVMTVLLAVSMQAIVAQYRRGAPWQRLLFGGAAALVVAAAIAVTLRVNTWISPPGIEVIEAPSCWKTLALKLRPALRPTDRLALDVLGYVSYVNPDVYVHDLYGLTDSYVAQHGDHYERRFGKFSPGYTLHQVRPTIFAVVYERYFLPLLVEASSGSFDAEYTTFDVPRAVLSCEVRTGGFLLSVRNDIASRILQSLGEGELPMRKAADIVPAPPLGRTPFWRAITIIKRPERRGR